MSATVAEARSTVLTRAESQQYDERGYLLRERAFSAAECADIAAECESLLSDLSDRDRRTILFSHQPAGLPHARLFRRGKP